MNHQHHRRLLPLALLLFLISGAIAGCTLLDVEPQFEESSRKGYAVTNELGNRLERIQAIDAELDAWIASEGLELPAALQAKLVTRASELATARDEAADAKEAFKSIHATTQEPPEEGQ